MNSKIVSDYEPKQGEVLRLRGGSFFPPYPMCMGMNGLGYQHQCFPNVPYQCFPGLMYNSPLSGGSNGPIIIVPLQNFQQIQTPTQEFLPSVPSQPLQINEYSPQAIEMPPDANSTFSPDSNIEEQSIDPVSDSPFVSPPFKSSFNQARLHKEFYPHIPKRKPRPAVEAPKVEQPKEVKEEVFHSMAGGSCGCSDESVSEHNTAMSTEERQRLENQAPLTEKEIQRREIEQYEREQQARYLRYGVPIPQQQMQQQQQTQESQVQQVDPEEEARMKEIRRQLFLLGLDNELKERQAELVQKRFLDIYKHKCRPPKMKVHNTFA